MILFPKLKIQLTKSSDYLVTEHELYTYINHLFLSWLLNIWIIMLIQKYRTVIINFEDYTILPQNMHLVVCCRLKGRLTLLVPFSWCGKMPWAKATYGRKSLFWLMIPEGKYIMVGKTRQWVTGAQSWEVASLSTCRKQRVNWKWGEVINSQSLLSVTCSIF